MPGVGDDLGCLWPQEGEKGTEARGMSERPVGSEVREKCSHPATGSMQCGLSLTPLATLPRLVTVSHPSRYFHFCHKLGSLDTEYSYFQQISLKQNLVPQPKPSPGLPSSTLCHWGPVLAWAWRAQSSIPDVGDVGLHIPSLISFPWLYLCPPGSALASSPLGQVQSCCCLSNIYHVNSSGPKVAWGRKQE
jgi:hypothetical protein